MYKKLVKNEFLDQKAEEKVIDILPEATKPVKKTAKKTATKKTVKKTKKVEK